MKILVAGGAGYIGSLLVPALLDHGYEIDVIDLFWFGDHLPAEANKFKKDLFECKEKDLEQYDQIIYLGGLSNDPMAEFDTVNNFIYNAALPANLALHAKRAGVKRFIYASTCSVYGYTEGSLFDEESKISCSYPYGVSKLQGEKGCMHLQDDNFSVICFRKGTVSGVSPRMRFDLIVNTMFKFAMTERVINISNPSIWRPIIGIRDVISAYLRAVQANDRISGVFNLAYDNYTVGDVAYTVKSELEYHGVDNIKLNILGIQDIRDYKVTCQKAKTVLGFHPRDSVTDLVKELYANWSRWKDNISDDQYYNIETFKKQFA